MAEFRTDLIVKELADNLWELTQPLSYASEVFGGMINVPTRFKTDFASVPRVPLAYWLAGGTAEKAAVIHDYLYQTQPCTRKKADDVLLEAMAVIQVPLWRRRLIYFGVRVGGWWAWYRSEHRSQRLGNG